MKTLSTLFLHTLLGAGVVPLCVGNLILQASSNWQLAIAVSSCLVPLTWLITQVCFLISGYQVKSLQALWLGILISNEALHFSAFTTGSLFGFFVAYEMVLIPLQALIAYWGSGVKRLRASMLFFLFTYGGSTPMLISVLYLTSFTNASELAQVGSFYVTACSLREGQGLWLAFALSFATKTPLFPFFIWLLFAHAEAPVEGSMLLAGVVLKLATYGVVTILMGLLWECTVPAMPISLAAAGFTLLMASISLVQQVDLKGYVALSSVAHMGNGSMGLLNLSEESVGGALVMGLSHGMVSPCLFFIVGGLMYGGFTTRLIYAYRGLLVMAPVMGTLLMLHLFANMAVPLSPNWISELLILAGLSHQTLLLCFLSSLNILASAVYTLWLSSRVVLGTWSKYLRSTGDLGFLEYSSLALLTSLTLALGLFAQGTTQALMTHAWAYAT